ncbi:MAG: ElyC/SanA/YdcF family protein [Cyanobacteria bacterium P01_D01_bin.73]
MGQVWARLLSRRSRFWSLVVGTVIALLLIALAVSLNHNRQQPVDTIFVLGGSVRREMYLAETLPRGENVPVLVSNGSSSPCVRALYEREGRSPDGVYIEHCARSTFDNFTYGLPFFRQWHSRHIQLLTSGSHVGRSTWLGRLMLGAHGIWVDIVDVPETGVPGNVERWWKTGLDLGRALLWLPFSYVYEPRCNQVDPLPQVDLDSVCFKRWLRCENQANLKNYCEIRDSKRTLESEAWRSLLNTGGDHIFRLP